jgi:hypothetical protein
MPRATKKQQKTATNKNGRARTRGHGRGKGGGRPEKEIDPRVVEGMAGVGATLGEIAEFLEVSHDTIERRFALILRKAKAGQKIRLRRAQMSSALGDPARGIAGNVSMQIWLGKQVLGQTEVAVQEAPQQELSQQSIMIGDTEIFF